MTDYRIVQWYSKFKKVKMHFRTKTIRFNWSSNLYYQTLREWIEYFRFFFPYFVFIVNLVVCPVAVNVCVCVYMHGTFKTKQNIYIMSSFFTEERRWSCAQDREYVGKLRESQSRMNTVFPLQMFYLSVFISLVSISKKKLIAALANLQKLLTGVSQLTFKLQQWPLCWYYDFFVSLV